MLGIAIFAILSIFGAGWFFVMARNPEEWRGHLLSAFGVVDLKTSRTKRLQQAGIFAIISYIMSVILLLAGIACMIWVVMKVREGRPETTDYDREREGVQRQLDKIRTKKSFKKLE